MPGTFTRLTGLRVGPTGAGAAADIQLIKKLTGVSQNPGAIGAATTADVVLTVTGAVVGDLFTAHPPANLNAGLIPVGSGECRVAGQVVVRIANVTAGSLDAPAGDWSFIQIRA